MQTDIDMDNHDIINFSRLMNLKYYFTLPAYVKKDSKGDTHISRFLLFFNLTPTYKDFDSYMIEKVYMEHSHRRGGTQIASHKITITYTENTPITKDLIVDTSHLLTKTFENVNFRVPKNKSLGLHMSKLNGDFIDNLDFIYISLYCSKKVIY